MNQVMIKLKSGRMAIFYGKFEDKWLIVMQKIVTNYESLFKIKYKFNLSYS